MNVHQVEKHIYKNEETKLFNVRVVVNPFTRKASGISTLGAARSKVLLFKSELQDLRNKRSKGVVTFEKASALFLEHRGSRYSASGRYNLSNALDRYSGDLKTMLITDITREHIEQLGNRLLTTLKPVTVDRIIRNFRAVFVYLTELGKIDRNPSIGIKYSRISYDRKLSAMSRDEMIRLMSFVEETNHHLLNHFKLAYFTGARSGELKELRVKDYNKELGHVVISRSTDSKTKTIGATKNGRSRVVPLSPQANSLFQSLIMNKDKEALVLPSNKIVLLEA